MDDAEFDSLPTRVIRPEERPRLSSAPPPPAPTSLASGKLPPPPRLASFRSRLPTEPSVRIQAASPPPSTGSVPPIALSAPPPPMELPIRRIPRGVVAAASVAAAALLAVGLLGAKGAIFASHGGNLVTTVAGAGGQPVANLSVFVDGAKRCESSPCRVEGLDVGSHFVKVSAPGYIPTAAQAVAVQSGQDAVMRLELTPEAPKADAKTADSDKAASDTNKAPSSDSAKSDDQGAVQANSLPATPAPVAHHYAWHPRHAAIHHSTPAEKREAPAAKPAAPAAPTGKGIIILSSTPATNVVVDGHPLGSTPKAVRVDAGMHTIVFAGEAGRAVRSIKVNPDDHLNVAVRF